MKLIVTSIMVIFLSLYAAVVVADYSSTGKNLPSYYPVNFSEKAVIQEIKKRDGISLVVEGVVIRVDAFAKVALLSSASGNLYDLHEGMSIGYELAVDQQDRRTIKYIWELPGTMVPALP